MNYKPLDPATQKQLMQIHKETYEIQVEVLEGGTKPHKAHPTDAGFDLYATYDIEIMPGEILKHPLNIRMKLPRGTYAQIESKSGLGSKGLLVYAGVIDETYRGIPHDIGVNLGKESIVIKAGAKLAQMTMRQHSNEFYMWQVESVDTDTDRGTGGFGSTGA